MDGCGFWFYMLVISQFKDTAMANRNLNKQVREEILNTSRKRCCLSGHIIDIDDYVNDLTESTLDKHHIIYISEDGDNSEDNIIMVCSNCHRKIHARPELYPKESLKEAKKHWKHLEQLIAPELHFQSEDNLLSSSPAITIRFTILALNLHYKIHTPENTTIGELSKFIREWILRPLVLFAGLAPFSYEFEHFELLNMKLALSSNTKLRLDKSTFIKDLEINENDSIVALADIRHVAAMKLQDEDKIGEIILSWGKQPKDLDLHFQIEGNGNKYNVSYQSFGMLEQFPFAKLDKDITDGYGPETITFGIMAKSKYRIMVHNYSGETMLKDSRAKVLIKFAGQVKEFICPSVGEGRWWFVMELDTVNNTINQINEIR